MHHLVGVPTLTKSCYGKNRELRGFDSEQGYVYCFKLDIHLSGPVYYLSADEDGDDDTQSDHGKGHRDSLGELFPPVLSSSAPALQGDWKEVRRRMKEKKDKKQKVIHG